MHTQTYIYICTHGKLLSYCSRRLLFACSQQVLELFICPHTVARPFFFSCIVGARPQEAETATRPVHLGFGFVNMAIRGTRRTEVTPAALRAELRERFPTVRLSLREQSWVVHCPGVSVQQESFSFSWAPGSPNPHDSREQAFNALLRFLQSVSAAQ